MNFLTNPTTQTVLEVYIAFYIFSALVQSLPDPSAVGGIWYKAFYNFLTIIASDFKSFIKTIPTTSTTSTTAATIQPSGAVTEVSTTSKETTK